MFVFWVVVVVVVRLVSWSVVVVVVAVLLFVVHAVVDVVVGHVRFVSCPAVRFVAAIVDPLFGYCRGVCFWCCSCRWVALYRSC